MIRAWLYEYYEFTINTQKLIGSKIRKWLLENEQIVIIRKCDRGRLMFKFFFPEREVGSIRVA